MTLVAAVQLTAARAHRLLYSSAWDYSVRYWRRSQPHTCVSVINLGDWVWSVKPKGNSLLVGLRPGFVCNTAGTGLGGQPWARRWVVPCPGWPPAHLDEPMQPPAPGQSVSTGTGPCPPRPPGAQVAAGKAVHALDIATGSVVRQYAVSEPGMPSSVEGSHDGRLLFAPSPHKALLAFDLRSALAPAGHCLPCVRWVQLPGRRPGGSECNTGPGHCSSRQEHMLLAQELHLLGAAGRRPRSGQPTSAGD